MGRIKNIHEIESLYFLGAGGIGMSALERFFMAEGKRVAGYDKTPSELTEALVREGAAIHYSDSADLIPSYCRNPETTLVVYTPAVPSDHKELCWFREHGFDIQKRAQVLGTLTRSKGGLCVAGTHGKTTTSAMTAHIMNQKPEGVNAFLGGILKNYESNLLQSSGSDYVVIEADEFDRSFHSLTPLRTVITAIDADHLDIYGTYEAYLESFNHYVSLIKEGGDLILHRSLLSKITVELPKGVRLHTYSLDEGDYHAAHVCVADGEIHFDLITPQGRINGINLGVPVRINIENSVAAAAMAQLSGASDEEIRCGIETFRGCDRRFDFHVKNKKRVYISDYAHHPEELRQCALSVRELYARRKITAIFQPHLYTRTQDFYKEFARSLSLFDEVYLLDIYPARELPIEGVTSELIARHIKEGVCRGVLHKEELPGLIESIKDDLQVLLTIGAGNVEDYVPVITTILGG